MEVSDTSTRGVQSTITKHPLGTASTLPPTITTTKAIAEGSLASGKPIEANAVFVETLGTNLRLVKTSFRQIFFVCLYAFLCLAGSWPRYEISGAVTRLWPSHQSLPHPSNGSNGTPHPSNTFLLIFRPPVWSQISQKDSLLAPSLFSHTPSPTTWTPLPTGFRINWICHTFRSSSGRSQNIPLFLP